MTKRNLEAQQNKDVKNQTCFQMGIWIGSIQVCTFFHLFVQIAFIGKSKSEKQEQSSKVVFLWRNCVFKRYNKQAVMFTIFFQSKISDSDSEKLKQIVENPGDPENWNLLNTRIFEKSVDHTPGALHMQSRPSNEEVKMKWLTQVGNSNVCQKILKFIRKQRLSKNVSCVVFIYFDIFNVSLNYFFYFLYIQYAIPRWYST